MGALLRWMLLGLLACDGGSDTVVPDTDDSDPPTVPLSTGDTGFALPELPEPWVPLRGGTFWMGSDPPAPEERETPAIEVTIGEGEERAGVDLTLPGRPYP